MEHGGYLVEITSAEEETLVDTNFLHGRMNWIGLSDIDIEGILLFCSIYKIQVSLSPTGKYIWSESGEEAVYTNWAEGQPDPEHALPEVENSFKTIL